MAPNRYVEYVQEEEQQLEEGSSLFSPMDRRKTACCVWCNRYVRSKMCGSFFRTLDAGISRTIFWI